MSNTHEALHKSAMAIYSRLEAAQKEIKELRAALEVQHALIEEVVRIFGDSRFEHDDERAVIAAAKDYLK